jgi:hypothetical protein
MAVINVGINPKNIPTTLIKIDLVSNPTPSIILIGLDIMNTPITPNIIPLKTFFFVVNVTLFKENAK